MKVVIAGMTEAWRKGCKCRLMFGAAPLSTEGTPWTVRPAKTQTSTPAWEVIHRDCPLHGVKV